MIEITHNQTYSLAATWHLSVAPCKALTLSFFLICALCIRLTAAAANHRPSLFLGPIYWWRVQRRQPSVPSRRPDSEGPAPKPSPENTAFHLSARLEPQWLLLAESSKSRTKSTSSRKSTSNRSSSSGSTEVFVFAPSMPWARWGCSSAARRKSRHTSRRRPNSTRRCKSRRREEKEY